MIQQSWRLCNIQDECPEIWHIDRKPSKITKAIADVQKRHILTPVKGVRPDAWQISEDMHGGQAAAIVERSCTDISDLILDNQFLKQFTVQIQRHIVEWSTRIIIHMGIAELDAAPCCQIVDVDALQRTAAPEGRIAENGDAGRNVNGGQTIVSEEGVMADGRNPFFDDQLLNGLGIIPADRILVTIIVPHLSLARDHHLHVRIDGVGDVVATFASGQDVGAIVHYVGEQLPVGGIRIRRPAAFGHIERAG